MTAIKQDLIDILKATKDGQRITLTHEPHHIDYRRLQWKSDIHEQCQCAVWCLWERSYEFCDESDIPVSHSELESELIEYAEMSQEERNKHRKFVADGLYRDDGVKHPCPICGYQAESEAYDDNVDNGVLSSSLERKITDIMECVHNLDGNYDESEVRRVANALRDLTQSEFSEIQSLTFDDLFPNGDDE